MKKRFLIAAMAAAMVSPLAAHANATVYGNVHLSIDSYDQAVGNRGNTDELVMNSNTSAIGVKGSEDLGGGVSAIYKVEFQIDPSEQAGISDRDQWVGLKSAMGTVKFGTMSSNYKQTGAKVDPMYRTPLEGRGMLGLQTSNLHGGAGESRGRMNDTLQYSSPKMGGLQAVFNTTFNGGDDETMGLGIRYVQKGVMAYFDYIDTAAMQAGNLDAAMKIGGKYKMDALVIGAQFEMVEDSIATDDVFFLSADYQLNDSDNIAFTFGDNGADDAGFALMYNHNLSNRTNVYAGYGDNASNTDADDNQVMTLGMRHKF